MTVSVMMPVLMTEPTWQLPMTVCALDTLRRTTDMSFEMVVVETAKAPTPEIQARADVYIHRPYRTNPTTDCNIGLDACTGDQIVYTGNDIFVRPGWIEALLQAYMMPHSMDSHMCGAATLASADLKHTQQPLIQEGIYGPFMMFDKAERFDADTFPCQFADTDLIMRLYSRGLRMIRNWNVVIQHLNRQTLSGPDNDRDFAEAKKRFVKKHAGSPLLMYKILVEGHVV